MNSKLLIGLMVLSVLLVGCVQPYEAPILTQEESIEECSGLCKGEDGVYQLGCNRWCNEFYPGWEEAVGLKPKNEDNAKALSKGED